MTTVGKQRTTKDNKRRQPRFPSKRRTIGFPNDNNPNVAVSVPNKEKNPNVSQTSLGPAFSVWFECLRVGSVIVNRDQLYKVYAASRHTLAYYLEVVVEYHVVYSFTTKYNTIWRRKVRNGQIALGHLVLHVREIPEANEDTVISRPLNPTWKTRKIAD
ncbi:hypothetical protein L596_002331 [Steinernema carpocapsae]|uniref:Uncharacterized protein n=1 Tax=Steinernema carpocapsae TaxID=34508 RepID=A0A4U8UPA1_STECR|nr:hypothetical protein L596_002331 [Steinernema carpocapsae]